MKSSEDTKIENAYNHAFNYYKQHGRSLDNQNTCINQMVGLTGFDRNTCIEIQSPVQSIMMYNETVELAHTIVQQQLNTVTSIIRGRLLDINNGKIQSKLNIYTPPPPPDTSPLANITENTVELRNVPNAVNTLVQHAIQQNGAGKGVDAIKSVQNFNLSYDLLKDNDAAVLNDGLYGYTIKAQTFNLGNNSIRATGIDHLVKGSIGMGYILSGGKDINQTMQGIFTLSTTSIVHLNLCNNNIGDVGAEIICHALINGKMKNTKTIDVSGNKNITQNGWEYFATAVKKVQANTIVIKVAAADTLQGMKEFLTKGFKHYTKTHKIVVTKEFQDELLGLNTSSCEKTKDNVLKAAKTAAFIKSLTNGNDYFILAAGAEAGAMALLNQDTVDCYKQCIGDVQKWFNDID